MALESSPSVATTANSLMQLNLIGDSTAFRAVVRTVERVARTAATTFIQGETGTGKEVVARAIHYLGARSSHPFVPINCGALPESLFENELFGHKRGAFTGAASNTSGLLELAQGGTLFLDEIDALSLKSQVGLLRFLQDGRYRPLGSHHESSADVRIIAACNCDLNEAIRSGRLRSDLYYRLKLLTVELPPLRAREGDAVLLAEHFLQACAQRYCAAPKRLHPQATYWLKQYQWPGNVRELENLVHREFLLSDTDELELMPANGTLGFASNSTSHHPSEVSELPAYAYAKAQALEDFDKRYLTRLLVQTGGNVTHAAKLAGKERRALGKLIKRYNLSASL